MEIMKICPNCKETKLLHEYYTDNARKDGWSFYCKKCTAAICKKSREKRKAEGHRYKGTPYNADTNRFAQLKHYYNLTREEYDRLVIKQSYLCAICESEPRGNTRLHVDHDHKTNQVRGLLCDDCNNGLGRFEDDIELLRKAIEYLQNPPAKMLYKEASST